MNKVKDSISRKEKKEHYKNLYDKQTHSNTGYEIESLNLVF